MVIPLIEHAFIKRRTDLPVACAMAMTLATPAWRNLDATAALKSELLSAIETSRHCPDQRVDRNGREARIVVGDAVGQE